MAHLLKTRSELTLFDVGAHKGETALEMRKIFPKAQVFSFEPLQESYGELIASAGGDPRIHCFNIGFSDMVGTQQFHVNALAATSSLLQTTDVVANSADAEIYQSVRTAEIQLTTVDEFVLAHNISRIDILKLDVQCAEHLVIKGAKNFCMRGGVLIIYAELVAADFYKGQLSFPDMLASYYDNDFVLYNTYNIKLDHIEAVEQLDAIFCYKPWLQASY